MELGKYSINGTYIQTPRIARDSLSNDITAKIVGQKIHLIFQAFHRRIKNLMNLSS